MVDDFAFSEVVRKLANLIRIGKIVEIDGANVKVKIGKVTTGWLPLPHPTRCDTMRSILLVKDKRNNRKIF